MGKRAGRKRRFKSTPPELIEQIYQHQRWLASNGRAGERLEVDRLDCYMLDLAGVDLSQARLKKADFFACDLSTCRFVNADLENAVISDCQLRNTSFTGADLRESYWAGSNYAEADLEGADTKAARWHPRDDDPDCGSFRPESPSPAP